ncbi:MAG: DinB family protein [Vicinamibacterales bacterium]
MLEMLRDLVAHKGHSNARLLSAIRECPAAASDPELWNLLHHILLANRFWLLTVLGAPFVHDEEARLSSSFDELIGRYGETQAQEVAWLDAAAAADLERILADERIPNGRCSVAQAFVQVCLHSHGHRAQCAKLLRRHGGVPPASDFILWPAQRSRDTTRATT